MIAQRYTGTVEEDLLLAGWYANLHMNGDWDKCFLHPRTGIGWFYTYFHKDVQLWYVVEQQTLILAGWFEPLNSGGAFFSLWVHPEHRRRRRMLQAYGELLDYALDRTHILLGVTKQEQLLDGHRKMGYTVVGPIPGLWGKGQDAWLVSLTRAQLEGGSYGRSYGRGWERRRGEHTGVGSPPTPSEHRVADGPPVAAAGP